MAKIHDFHDGETVRRQRNLTENQKKNNSYTQEGIIVNSYCKSENNFKEISDSLIISRETPLPKELEKTSKERNLIPISGIALGVMTTITGFTYFLKKNTQAMTKLNTREVLPTLTRHVALNEETHQAIYRMVRNPNRQTILAGSGVLALTATAFMGKMFLDGFKEVWVKKREADIQKHLQEQLISVETQTFSGKMQIIRNMLSTKTQEFDKVLGEMEKSQSHNLLNFKGNPAIHSLEKQEKKENNMAYLALGVATIVGIVALGFLSIRNLTKGKKSLEDGCEALKNSIPEIVRNSSKATMEEDKEILTQLFTALGTPKKYIKAHLQNLNWDKADIEEFENQMLTSTAKINKAIGGDGTDKPTYYSHVDDYRAHLYNYLLDSDNRQFKQLFFGIAGVSALGYMGKLTGEAIKEVEVKKINAQTELELQQRLVSTELRNFKSKKDAVINPLIDEFYKKKAENTSKDELKTVAENILYEIKNGAPFVYS